MTHEDTKTRDLSWGAPPPRREPPVASPFARFLGDSPASVITRLFFLSLVVGALLMWLDVRPYEIFRVIERLFTRLWALGFDAVREVVAYVIAGAAVVVPIWIVMRLLAMRGAR